MDAYWCIVSKREVRRYTDDPIPAEVLERILQAGRVTGNARNRQRWAFYVVGRPELLARLAETVAAPENVRGCRVAIALVLLGQSPFDAGRAAQNMMLAAWSSGVGSCPNTVVTKDACRSLLGLPAEADIATVLSFGYPAEPVPRERDAAALLRRVKRKPLEELVRYVDEPAG